jgi:polysaccharide pyruvyl transferase CsaB
MKILIYGSYGYGNFGDETILEGIIQDLKERYKNPEILVFSFSPIETKNLHDVNSRKINIRDILSSRRIIIGGGGIFFDQIIRGYLYFILISLIFRKKVEIYGVGVSKLKNPINRNLIRILNKCEKISVRDFESRKILKSYGIRKNIDVIDDPAITFLEKFKVNKKNKIGKKIGISIRYIRDEKQNLEIEKCFIKFIDYLTDINDFKVYFFPFCIHKKVNFENDIILAKKLKSNIKNPEKFIIQKFVFNPQSILKSISEMDFFIGMRLHSLIYANKLKLKSLAIVYDNKIFNIIKNKKELFLDLNELSLIKLKSKFNILAD